MRLTHTNGHAALQVVTPRPLPAKLVNARIDLDRPVIWASQRASRKRPEAPAPAPLTPTPAPEPPKTENVGGTERKPAKPVRRKAAVPRQSRSVAKEPRQTPDKATGRKEEPRRAKSASTVRATKKEQILALLRRPHGATLAELMDVSGWQSHSVRGFLSGAVHKKMNLKIRSRKRADGARAYSIRG